MGKKLSDIVGREVGGKRRSDSEVEVSKRGERSGWGELSITHGKQTGSHEYQSCMMQWLKHV